MEALSSALRACFLGWEVRVVLRGWNDRREMSAQHWGVDCRVSLPCEVGVCEFQVLLPTICLCL